MATSRKALKPRDLHQDYQDAFRSEAGKSVLDDLEKTAFFHRTSFVPNDPYHTAHNEGLRALVLRIHYYLNSQPLEDDGSRD